jgi:hypothetical protein
MTHLPLAHLCACEATVDAAALAPEAHQRAALASKPMIVLDRG